jgi:hypothetical protein
MTTSLPTVFTILDRAVRRFSRQWPAILAAVVAVPTFNLILTWLAQPTEGSPSSGVFLGLIIASFVAWFLFGTFCLSLLSRSERPLDTLTNMPALTGRCLAAAGILLWHTWILAGLLGSLALVVSPDGFQASVLILWACVAVVAAIRLPTASLTPVLVLQSTLSPRHALTRSQEATKNSWGYVAITLAVVAGATFALLRLLDMTGVPDMGMYGPALQAVVSLTGQALFLATIVELKEALIPHHG